MVSQCDQTVTYVFSEWFPSHWSSLLLAHVAESFQFGHFHWVKEFLLEWVFLVSHPWRWHNFAPKFQLPSWSQRQCPGKLVLSKWVYLTLYDAYKGWYSFFILLNSWPLQLYLVKVCVFLLHQISFVPEMFSCNIPLHSHRLQAESCCAPWSLGVFVHRLHCFHQQ